MTGMHREGRAGVVISKRTASRRACESPMLSVGRDDRERPTHLKALAAGIFEVKIVDPSVDHRCVRSR